MYAIPAETASQSQPFQKENLPGPGKHCQQVSSAYANSMYLARTSRSPTARP